MYILVEFTDDNEVAVIPHNWLDGNRCAVWPTHFKQRGKLESAVKNKMAPGDDWPAFPVKEMYRNELYIRVRERLKRAEVESDLATSQASDESEEEYRRSKRQKQIPNRLYSSDEDSPVKTNSRTRVPQPPSPVKTKTCVTSLQYGLGKNTEQKKQADQTIRGGIVRKPVDMPSVIQSPSPPVTPTPTVTSTPTTSRHDNNRETYGRSNQSGIVRDVRLFTILEKMGRQQTECLNLLNQVLGVVNKMASGPNGPDPFEKPADLDLPVSSVEELETAELVLEDCDQFNGLVTFLSHQGGISRSDMVKRVLKLCMANKLAVQFNWFGKKGKRAFGKLKLAKAVIKAVMKYNKQATASEIEFDCREWFRLASDREGGRKRRSKDQRQIMEEVNSPVEDNIINSNDSTSNV